MASEVEIVNNALLMLGDKQISTLDDPTDSARLAKAFYPDVRNDVLSDFPWNFAVKRVKLAKLATSPLWEFKNAYQLPVDVLRVLDTDNSKPWKREGNQILSDADPMSIKYIAKIEDPEAFTPRFREVLAVRLASKIAFPLTKKASLGQELFNLYLAQLQDAKSLDSQEGTQDQIEANLLIDVRNNG